MRQVFEDQESARVLGARARDDVLTRFSVDRTAAFLRERLAAEPRGAAATGKPNDGTLDATRLGVIRNELALGPGGRFVRAKPRRPGVRALRGATRRVLWPYMLDQHALVGALADTIAGLHKRVGQVEGDLSGLPASVGWLEAELTASPYVSDPSVVWTTDSDGNRQIGYDSGKETQTGAVYRRFEDVFRGGEKMIADRQRPYLEKIGDRAPVLDVGCGRGEFLELLRDAGIEARGIDVDADMVSHCEAKDLAVEQADVVSFLDAQPDRSLGVIFSAQLIEHLDYEELLRFFDLAHAKLGPDGLFVAETVNPHSIRAFKAFWTDPTHRSPIFPEVAVHWLACTDSIPPGCFPLGSGDVQRDLRTCGEYALVARRGSERVDVHRDPVDGALRAVS